MTTVQNVNFKLKSDTLNYISKTTKLTSNELCSLSIEEAKQKMFERGALKKENPIKKITKQLYKKFGEKLGLIEKQVYIYTDCD